MNFNYDLVTWIDYFVGAFFCGLGLFFSYSLISSKDLRKIKFYKYFILIIFAIIVIFNNFIFSNAIRTFVIIILLFAMFKFFYNDKNGDLIINVVFTYIVCIISESTFSIIILLFELIFKINYAPVMTGMWLTNFIIALLLVIYSYLFRKQIKKVIDKLKATNVTYIFLLSILTIIVVFSLMYSLYLNNFNIDYKYFLSAIVIIGCFILFFILIKQYVENKETENKYILLKEYLKNSADLIEKYSSTIHKYKNNLIIIKGYLKDNNKGANEYINTLLDDYKNKKYNWFSKINYIQIEPIRYLIYYKLSKAENENLKIVVDVSKNVKNYTNNLINNKKSNILLEIMGELFDNAIYASTESKEKRLNFILYNEDNNLIFKIVNTYKGQVNLSLITKNGYTTKGMGHGLGLYDIEKNLKKNDWIKIEYELDNNYFIVTMILITKKL